MNQISRELIHAPVMRIPTGDIECWLVCCQTKHCY